MYIPDSILNSQHLDDGDDNLDVAMPDDLNDQNLSELASSISAHDLNSMSQALTVSVLNSALDINTNNVPNSGSSSTARSVAGVAQGPNSDSLSTAPNSGNLSSAPNSGSSSTARSGAGVAQGPRLQEVNGQAVGNGTAVQAIQQLPAGVRPGQPVTFPILQGQLLHGHLVANAPGAGSLVQSALTPVTAHRAPNTLLQNNARRLPNAALIRGPPNATVQRSAPNVQNTSPPNVQRTTKQPVPAPVVPVSVSSAQSPTQASRPRVSSTGGIVQNLLQSPPIVAPPPVHQHRPNILQSSRMNHGQSFQIQGHNIQAQDPSSRPVCPQGQGQPGQGRRQSEGHQVQGVQPNSQAKQKDRISVIQGQLPQGPALPQNQLQIQMPSAIAALGGTAFTVSPQGALMAATSGVRKTQPQLAGQLFSAPPSAGSQAAIPNRVPPPSLVPGQINGNVLNATEQLKQLVSQSPVTMTPNTLSNSKKRSSRSRRAHTGSNKHSANNTAGGLTQNHATSTTNQSQQTATTTLSLLTANQFRADGGLKLALPLQALLPSDVSAVLTTVNGTTQEASKPAAPVTPHKRSRSGSSSAKKQKT